MELITNITISFQSDFLLQGYLAALFLKMKKDALNRSRRYGWCPASVFHLSNWFPAVQTTSLTTAFISRTHSYLILFCEGLIADILPRGIEMFCLAGRCVGVLRFSFISRVSSSFWRHQRWPNLAFLGLKQYACVDLFRTKYQISDSTNIFALCKMCHLCLSKSLHRIVSFFPPSSWNLYKVAVHMMIITVITSTILIIIVNYISGRPLGTIVCW